MATLFVVLVTLIFPFTPLGQVFGFRELPISFSLLIGVIIMAYIVTAEVAKREFYRRVKF
jgi:Mg2+-importing ATPase